MHLIRTAKRTKRPAARKLLSMRLMEMYSPFEKFAFVGQLRVQSVSSRNRTERSTACTRVGRLSISAFDRTYLAHTPEDRSHPLKCIGQANVIVIQENLEIRVEGVGMGNDP